MSIRVLVADDHRILREGLVALLGAMDGITVLGGAGDGREAIRLVDADPPDVVIMDISMPVLDGIEATRDVTLRHPQVRVLILTMNEDDGTVLSALRAGASGYLLKGADAQELHRAIVATAAGGMVFGATVAARVQALFTGRAPGPALAGRPAAGPSQAGSGAPFPELTERERTVLELLAAGRTNDAIAARLHVSNKTVRNAVSAIYAKLHAADRADAIIKARNAGLGRG